MFSVNKENELAALQADTPREYKVIDIVQAVLSEPVNMTTKGGFTYLRIKSRVILNGEVNEFCADTSIGNNLVNRTFLEKHKYIVEKVPKKMVKGVGGPVSIGKIAIWIMLIEGFKADGTPSLLCEIATAYIVDNLGTGAFLGNQWIMSRKGRIMYKD